MTATAYAIIGVILDGDAVARKLGEVVTSCDHPQRVGNRFCPVCGRKVEESVEVDADDAMGRVVKSLGDGYLFHELHNDDDDDKQADVAIGYGTEASTDNDSACESAGIPDIGKVKDDLRRVLEPLGLWEDDSFGLHAIASYSY